jgi:serine protease DegQ
VAWIRRPWWLLALVACMLAACTSVTPSDKRAEQPGPVPTPAQGRPVLPSPSQAAASGLIPEIVAKVEPSVVAVLVQGGEGSGVVWSSDGIVVTNNHVVAGNQVVQLLFADGQRANAQVVATDPRDDLAVLRSTRHNLPAAKFATGLPRVGDLAIAIGNPLGFENSVTAGIVSGLNRSIPGSVLAGDQSLVDLLQTDAAISPGNSGGALVGASGEVIGINVAYIPPTARAVSLGFAIPATRVVAAVQQLLEDGTVDATYLGVSFSPLDGNALRQFGIDAPSGLLVDEVALGSPAARAGIQRGDVIIAVQGRAVQQPEDLPAAVRARRPGDQLQLGIRRGGTDRAVTVTLGEQPAG